MASWTTDTGENFEGKFKDTLVKRAKKRSGTQVGPRKWVVNGDTKLGDEYESYYVILPDESYKYSCSCQSHAGGEYRRLCSHKLYVMLAKRGKVEIKIDIIDEVVPGPP